MRSTCLARPGVRLRLLLIVVGLGALAGCGAIQPGTPGHEPPTAGNYNPVAREFNSPGR